MIDVLTLSVIVLCYTLAILALEGLRRAFAECSLCLWPGDFAAPLAESEQPACPSCALAVVEARAVYRLSAPGVPRRKRA